MRYRWLLISLTCCALACGGVTAATSSKPTVTPIPGASPLPPNSSLKEFRILSPQDDSVVNVPEIEVTGEAKPDTTITLNDEIVVVDQSGTFSVKLSLEEGPNDIEIVASDPEGNEVNVI